MGDINWRPIEEIRPGSKEDFLLWVEPENANPYFINAHSVLGTVYSTRSFCHISESYYVYTSPKENCGPVTKFALIE